MRNDSFFVGLKRYRAVWAAALVLSVAVGLGEPAAAEPVFSETETRNAPAGVLISADADGMFDNAGTNPKITGAVFSTTEYYTTHTIAHDGRLYVQPKTSAELNVLPSPPPDPFTVDVTVTMTNDEGQTASGTITFETPYERAASAQPGEPEAVTPVFSETETWTAPAGTLISADADGTFDNAGTNPRITGAEFSTTEYYTTHTIAHGRLWVQPKTAEELNALPPPPPSPFTVDVTVTMTNDEGQTASGTITFRTDYLRDASAQPGAPAAVTPVFSETETRNAPAGLYISADADGTFDNAGTNPKITGAVFSTTEYYSVHKVAHGRLFVQPKTSAELNALPSPPPDPFTVDVTVTMTNDEGQTASGTITFETIYDRAASAPLQPSGPVAVTPTFSVTEIYSARPGYLLNIPADNVFDNAGTNPKITGAEFSDTEYYRTHGVFRDRLWVEAKTDAELNALASPPPSPFTVDITVTMANDEDQTASGTITFETTYERDTPEQPGEASSPAFSQTETRNAPPGALVSGFAENLFDNAGTNPRITDAVFSTTEYYSVHSVSRGLVWVEAKTAEELNALASPPPDPFTVDITVTMANDEGQTASGTVTFETTYERVGPTGPPPVFRSTVWLFPPGQTNYRYARWSFDNAGTNAKFTDVSVSTMEYYDDLRINSAGAIQVTVKSDAELNALSPPPPSPFTVTADVAMTNDEGHRVTGTVAFTTTYIRTATE